MREIIILLTAAMLCVSCSEQFNAAYLLSGGAKVAQAAVLSDAQIQSYVGQYVQKLDAENTVLPETSPYVKRVRKMTSGITSVNGTPLNFKVYKTNEINAFACADGSVRIYSGLLDAMTRPLELSVTRSATSPSSTPRCSSSRLFLHRPSGMPLCPPEERSLSSRHRSWVILAKP